MIKYALCEGTTEIRIGGKLVTMTEDDLITDFWSEDVIEYDDIEIFDSIDAAHAAYSKTTPRYSPQPLRGVTGWSLRYSVVFVQKREYDDDGEEIDRIDEIECKTDGGYKPCPVELTDEQLADVIRDADYYTDVTDECYELCDRAGLLREWQSADAESFEDVLRKAAEVLDLDLGI